MAKIDPTQRKPIGQIVPGRTVLGRGYIPDIAHNHAYFRNHNKTGFKLTARSPRPKQIPNTIIAQVDFVHDALGNICPLSNYIGCMQAAMQAMSGSAVRGKVITAAYGVFDSIGATAFPDVFPVVFGSGMQLNFEQSRSGIRKKIVTICSASWVANYNAGHMGTLWAAGFFGIPARIYSVHVYAGVPGGPGWKPI